MKPLTTLQKLLGILFPTIIVTLLFTLISQGILLSFLYTVQRTGFGDGLIAERIDMISVLVSMMSLVARIATGIAFAVWMYRALRNVHEAGFTGVSHQPIWGVIGFVVPFLNLIVPVAIMRTLWSASAHMDRPDDHESWTEVAPPKRIVWWWLLFIAGNVLASIGVQLADTASELSHLIQGTWFGIAGAALQIPSAILVIALIGEVTRWQHKGWQPPAQLDSQAAL